MGDANRVQVSYVQESTFGAQETGSNLQILRLNNESLVHDKATTVSEEMRADRQVSDIVRIGVSTRLPRLYRSLLHRIRPTVCPQVSANDRRTNQQGCHA